MARLKKLKSEWRRNDNRENHRGSQALSKMISKIMNGTWKPLLPKFSAAQYLTLEGQSDQKNKDPHRSKSRTRKPTEGWPPG